MEEILENHNFDKQDVEIPMERTEKVMKLKKCNYASSFKGNLRDHMKTHSGEKSNKCNQCEYATAYASALRIHLKTHSGEKPNKCDQCDFASSDAGNLRCIAEKNHTSAANVNLQLFMQVVCGHI